MSLEMCFIDSVCNRYYDQGTDVVYKHITSVLDARFSKQYIVKRINEIKEFRKVLEYLLTIPVIEQRSPEWHEVRGNLITASDMGQALGVGKFGTVKGLYKKKSGYEEDKFNWAIPALIWGVKYEPIATKLYEKRQFTHIHDFGLILHPAFSFFGASPDGITDNGIMLEIKCPHRRVIDGHIGDQYYYQMQGQLEVANLEECDFLEAGFHEYIDEYDFMLDWNDEKTFTIDNNEKGIIIEFTNHPEHEYLYSVVGDDCETQNNWLKNNEEVMEMYEHKVTYYKLKTYNLQKVYRNKSFFKSKIKDLEVVWNNILKYRDDKSAYDDAVSIVKRKPGIYTRKTKSSNTFAPDDED
jgi:putative phage-type endonuclease